MSQLETLPLNIKETLDFQTVGLIGLKGQLKPKTPNFI